MSEVRINEEILKWIKEYCKDDEILGDFLKELILEEAENPGWWKWREKYLEKITVFSEKWSVHNEN